MIDDKECERLFRLLADELRSLGMGWVVDEVFEHIASGKGTHAVNVKFPKRAERVLWGVEEGEERDRGRSGFTRRIEFTAHERLALLAESAVSVVRDSVHIDQVLTKEFEKVSFIPEVPEESERGFTVNRPGQNRTSAAEILERRFLEFIAKMEE